MPTRTDCDLGVAAAVGFAVLLPTTAKPRWSTRFAPLTVPREAVGKDSISKDSGGRKGEKALGTAWVQWSYKVRDGNAS